MFPGFVHRANVVNGVAATAGTQSCHGGIHVARSHVIAVSQSATNTCYMSKWYPRVPSMCGRCSGIIAVSQSAINMNLLMYRVLRHKQTVSGRLTTPGFTCFVMPRFVIHDRLRSHLGQSPDLPVAMAMAPS